MQKAEAQHKHLQSPARQRQGAALEASRGEQPGQNDQLKRISFLGQPLEQLAALGNSTQRRILDEIQLAQRKEKYESLQGHSEPRQHTDDKDGALHGKFVASPPASDVAKSNYTGLPDNLKCGIEALSGLSMDNVRVHYNSGKPALLCALAYTQGNEIFLAPNQDEHLPHEAWHVVQQKMGRVQPQERLTTGQWTNTDKALEIEADQKGRRAYAMTNNFELSSKPSWKHIDSKDCGSSGHVAGPSVLQMRTVQTKDFGTIRTQNYDRFKLMEIYQTCLKSGDNDAANEIMCAFLARDFAPFSGAAILKPLAFLNITSPVRPAMRELQLSPILEARTPDNVDIPKVPVESAPEMRPAPENTPAPTPDPMPTSVPKDEKKPAPESKDKPGDKIRDLVVKAAALYAIKANFAYQVGLLKANLGSESLAHQKSTSKWSNLKLTGQNPAFRGLETSFDLYKKHPALLRKVDRKMLGATIVLALSVMGLEKAIGPVDWKLVWGKIKQIGKKTENEK